jgi:hypothetical protein
MKKKSGKNNHHVKCYHHRHSGNKTRVSQSVDVRIDEKTIIVTGFFESINERPIRKESTFTKYLESKVEWLQQLLFKWIVVAEKAELYNKLQSERTITLVSDS